MFSCKSDVQNLWEEQITMGAMEIGKDFLTSLISGAELVLTLADFKHKGTFTLADYQQDFTI